MDSTLDLFERMVRGAMQYDSHVKDWRWHLYSRHRCHVDRLGRARGVLGNRLAQTPRAG